MKKTIATVAALCAVAAVPAAAQAGQTIDFAHFKVTVKGVQTNSWKTNYEGTGKCDPSGSGHGTEVVRFEAKKAHRYDASRYGKYVTFMSDPVMDEITTKAKVTRHGEVYNAPMPPECGGTGGGGEPPAPDCGTKRFNYDVDVGYSQTGKKKGLTLSQGLIMPILPFKNCPVGGISFPQMLNADSKGKLIVGELPAKELFDKKLGKIIVLSKGRRVEKLPSLGIDRTSTIEWEVTLTRVKEK